VFAFPNKQEVSMLHKQMSANLTQHRCWKAYVVKISTPSRDGAHDVLTMSNTYKTTTNFSKVSALMDVSNFSTLQSRVR
jgi:hypothetical protein